MPQYPPYGQQQDAATTSSGLGAGAGDHLPVGDYGGMDYRSAMRFVQPSGWTAWTQITSATLKFFISDHKHVAPQNSSIFCSRMNVPVWTKDQGTQDCESGFSGSNTTQYGDIQSVSTDRITFGSGSTANAPKTLDVTNFVRYYWQNNSPLVFVFDNNGSGEYTELWSLGKSGTTYDAVLTINYEVQSPPTAPTPLGPIGGAISQSDTPTFSWTHNDPQGDAQASAEVRVWDAAGTTQVGTTRTVAGSTQSLVWPVALTRGVAYQWDVRTADAATGLSPTWSAKQAFSVKANPVVTISPLRRMTYNGQPRLCVDWTCDQPQASFRVTATGGYDSGIKSGSDQSWTLDTLALTNGTAVSITVQVFNTDAVALNASASRSFTPRWGLTTHKKTLAAVPVNWQTAAVVSTVPPANDPNGPGQLVIEYGQSAAAADAVPTSWVNSPTNLPKPFTQFLHWRAWFIPNNTTSPVLDSINIPYDSTVAVLDKWGTNPVWPGEANGGIPARFVIDTGEAVYGTRSLRLDPDGSARYIHSTKLKVREGRSYVLSGLMRSQGNSGAYFRLQNYTTVFATSQDRKNPLVLPVWPAGVLTDWERYKSAVWKAPADMEVFVTCITDGGVAGSTAWFDGLKLEESLVATPWNPASVGGTTVDAGGVQIDGTKGGVFRYKGTSGGVRDAVEGGGSGLNFGGDSTAQLWSPTGSELRTNANLVSNSGIYAVGASYTGYGSHAGYHVSGDYGSRLTIGGAADSFGKWALIAHGTIAGQYWSNAVRGVIQSRYGAWEVAMHINADAGMGGVEQPIVVTTRTLADGLGRPLTAKITIAARNPLTWYLFVQVQGNYEYLDWFPQDVTGEGSLPVIDNPSSTGWVASTSGAGYGTVEYLSRYDNWSWSSFPSNPATGQRAWRTDHNMEFFWDSARWLSSTLYLTPIPNGPAALLPFTVTQLASFRMDSPAGAITNMNLFVVNFHTSVYTSSAHNASNYWSAEFITSLVANQAGSLFTQTFNNTVAGNWAVMNSGINGFVNPASYPTYQVNWTKVGAPGSIYPVHTMSYRLSPTN